MGAERTRSKGATAGPETAAPSGAARPALSSSREPWRNVPTWYVLRETMLRPKRVNSALRLAASSLLLLLVFGACGDGDDAPPPPDPAAQCVPNFATPFTPIWHPPHAPRPGACTKAQITNEYTTCISSSGSQSGCTALRNNPTHKSCAECLNSRESDESYGAIIWRMDGSWRTNTGGCVAILDRDMSAEGCGARVQSASACADAACDGCLPFSNFVECRQKSSAAACRVRYLDSICLLRPQFAQCTDYTTNEEYYRATAELFCGTGPVTAAREGDVR